MCDSSIRREPMQQSSTDTNSYRFIMYIPEQTSWCCTIGVYRVARIYAGGALFFPEKVDDILCASNY